MNIFTYQDQSYHTGDTVRLHLNVAEGEKTRVQVFEGIVIAISGKDTGKSVLVRKIGANNIGVERLVPLMSPNLTKIELKSAGQVRRAKLYYLRDRVGRQATKVKTKVEVRTPAKKVITKQAAPKSKPTTKKTLVKKSVSKKSSSKSSK